MEGKRPGGGNKHLRLSLLRGKAKASVDWPS